ncbi:MAG: prephenate dehydrogenase dimerization domain-containing protein, partial [Terriglobia bacterium]
GAEPVEMDAETHDWAAALVSHVPQLLSTALASAVWDETDEDGLPVSLAGKGFQDMTRLAASPYEVWRDICLTNSENISRALERLEQKLERLRTQLRSKELADEFQKAWHLLDFARRK